MKDIANRLTKLRSIMQRKGIDALILPSSDPHQSEYLSEHWKSRAYFSGFNGSSGYLVLFKDYAALWTDSRYFLQAEKELEGSTIVLHKQQIPHSPEHIEWMTKKLKKGSKVGIEGLLFSLDQVGYAKGFFEKAGIELVNVDGILNEAWPDRPPKPHSHAYELDVRFCGESREMKMNALRKQLREKKADYMLISALDEIAWLLNIRAWDIEFTPVVLSYLLIAMDEATLYVNKERVEGDLIKALAKENIKLSDYEGVENDLAKIDKKKSIYLDKATVSWTFNDCIHCSKIMGTSLITMPKAIKNDTEIRNISTAMVKDGIALLHFFMWLEENVNKKPLSEYELVNKLAFFRSKQENYVGESFSAIVGFKGNGAIVHYSPDENKSARIEGEGMLLVDSGGQYLDGTTDITRTIYIGEPSREHKRNFTLVLKGNIALQNIQFPKGTTGMQLDTLARMYLWNEGLNYGHGTGHGVGFFLNVHEAPQGFATSPTTSRGLGMHYKGMLTSNEPGFYKRDEYGIRIENLMICEEAEDNEYASFLKFRSLTLFPISTKLIDTALLDAREKSWLNDYHAEVYQKLSPHLNDREKEWLKEKCKAIN